MDDMAARGASAEPRVQPPPFTPARPLPASRLRRDCDLAGLAFTTTEELRDLPGLVGQERALGALRTGIGIHRKGFNVFAFGPPGAGKHTMVEQLLRTQAASAAAPPDWCYVNNFTDPHRPKRLMVPTGRAATLRDAMNHLVAELKLALPAAFEREDYRTRHESIDQQFKHRHEETFGALQSKAEQKSIGLIRTPMGLALAPIRNGQVIPPDVFQRLPAEDRERIKSDIEALQAELESIVRKIPDWEREHRNAVRQLNRDTAAVVIRHLLEDVRNGFADLGEVVTYLGEVETDILEHAEEFMASDREGEQSQGSMVEAVSFRRYQVNVLVDNSGQKGAPVIYEDQPTHQGLVGRIEHLARFGALVTDFNLIVPGALHRANGGYLVLDAERLLAANFGWESLKRALRAGEIRTVSLEQLLSLASTVSLDPEPIPLGVKVIIIGSPLLYYLLSELDHDFPELFKIAADFDDRFERSTETTELYARLIASAARREKLRPLDRAAVARTIEEAARMSGDAAKLTAEIRGIVDLLQEADHLAATAGKSVIGRADIDAAIEGRRHRADRVHRRFQEEIARETLRIETAGERVGQVNGLSVITLGGMSFGRPSRITAQTRLGKGEVIDIEREVALGGPLHSKGVLILSAFLGGRFGRNGSLSLTASLVFEQSYGPVEGDSASAAELFALLSALANAAIRQCFAVTGSVDQHGNIQAIGGVNEKIEGFFDICKARGLSGQQGVLIPASNVQHLMLNGEVVNAVASGLFSVIPIETIDQGIEILTGVPAGEPDAVGSYPEGTINRAIVTKLLAFARRALPASPLRKTPTKRRRASGDTDE